MDNDLDAALTAKRKPLTAIQEIEEAIQLDKDRIYLSVVNPSALHPNTREHGLDWLGGHIHGLMDALTILRSK
jgi:hypothetical protein